MCFLNYNTVSKHTDWTVFLHQDLTVHTEAGLSYLKFCRGNVTAYKCIKVFPNQKPWKISQVKTLLKNHNTAFRSGNRTIQCSRS